MNETQHNQIVNFIWSIADDVLRDVYVRGKYRDVILPMTVIRRIDCLLEPTKDKVLEDLKFLNENLIFEHNSLFKSTGKPFYNTSEFTLKTLLNNPTNIKENFKNYLDGFSDNVKEIISKFKFYNQLETLNDANVLFDLIQKFTSTKINLSSEPLVNGNGDVLMEGLTNLGIGYVFEELIRKFNEENNEEAGEHFTPRDIIKLMTNIVFLPIEKELKKGAKFTIYDPACGSGGMLTESEKFGKLIAPKAKFDLYGQEVNPETWALCKADMLIKSGTQTDLSEYVFYGSTLSKDGFPNMEFDFMFSNPPYGKSWKTDQDAIFDEKKKEIKDDRFKNGLPKISDGQLLFLVNMLTKRKKQSALGSRIATVHNGSVLFSGDAGSGESNIRKWIIENDFLDCIIQMPGDMFYNTGLTTYIWLLSNKKTSERKGKIQLIDATDICIKRTKSLGKKANEFSDDNIHKITEIYLKQTENGVSKLFDCDDFGYYKITVERPLRIAFQFDEEKAKIEKWNTKFSNWIAILKKLFGTAKQMNFNDVKAKVTKYAADNDIKFSDKDKKDLFEPFISKDPTAEKVIKKKTKEKTDYEPDSDLRDTENVPLKEDITEYFNREVIPHAPDAWIDETKTIKGYEINFSRYFYKSKPLRTLDEIKADILALDKETEGLLKLIIS
jgi:type I restriction enzyme M protein